jgi:hypothetical protein
VIEPSFKGKLEELSKQNLLPEMGVSIRAIGEAQPMTIQGVNTNHVESLVKARSVDFVTYAGAGGQVEAIESDKDGNDVDLIGESDLRTRRPDLINLIESTARKDNPTMKTLEQQLQESNEKLAAATKALNESQEREAKANKIAAAAELTKLLTESKLPEKAQEKLRKQFAEAADTKGMKEAIDFEVDYITSITGKKPAAGSGVRGMGTRENGHQESATEEIKDEDLKKNLLACGFSEAAADQVVKTAI